MVDKKVPTDPEQVAAKKPQAKTISRKASRKARQAAEVQSTGHSWDGIEEYDNPLPRWWLWTFYACIVWAIGYVIAYPAWPLITKATPGLLQSSTRADVAEEIKKFDAMNAPLQQKLVDTEMTAIANDPELVNYTTNAGRATFSTYCSQCHGSGAAGAVGYPNLLDNDWIWGGDIDTIYTTIKHGVRSEDDDDTRISDMPQFGVDELLEPAQIDQVVEHVLAISGQDHDAELAAEGAVVFEENCASCHGEQGEGMVEMGAPTLNDQIWLYGGSRDAIHYTVVNARRGVMPSWSATSYLSDADIRAVAAYVHGLGGGQ